MLLPPLPSGPDRRRQLRGTTNQSIHPWITPPPLPSPPSVCAREIRVMDQREEDQDQDHLLLRKEGDDSLCRCKEQLLGPCVHTINLGQKTGVQVLGSSGNAACSVLSGSGSGSVTKRGCGRPRNGGHTTPMQSPWAEGDSSLMHKRGRGRPRKQRPSAAISAETGDETSAPPETGAATPAEAGDAASMGIKRPCRSQERRSQQQECLLKLEILLRRGSSEGYDTQYINLSMRWRKLWYPVYLWSLSSLWGVIGYLSITSVLKDPLFIMHIISSSLSVYCAKQIKVKYLAKFMYVCMYVRVVEFMALLV